MKKYFLIAVLTLGITARPTHCTLENMTKISGASAIASSIGAYMMLQGNAREGISLMFAGAAAAAIGGIAFTDGRTTPTCFSAFAPALCILVVAKAFQAAINDDESKPHSQHHGSHSRN